MARIPKKSKIQTRLLAWFEKHGRDLPWRKTGDPYSIWVSEIMLQQTQVATVIPYYEKFLKSFPTLAHLARADLSRVLRAWEGLGYYSRARNLHRAARTVSNHFQGKVPDTVDQLLSLPGIGRYTAGAILSIAYNREAPILDGNVKRVLSRLFIIGGDPTEKETETHLWSISESLIPKGEASFFNQALMDLGATICTPKGPTCLICPLRDLCKAGAAGNPEAYPARAEKRPIPTVKAIAAVILRDGKALLRQRPPEGLLGGLWEFPNWEIEGKTDLNKQLKNLIKNEIGLRVKGEGLVGPFNQAFSHFKLSLSAYQFQASNGKGKGRWVPIQKLYQFPMSRIHRRIANTLEPD